MPAGRKCSVCIHDDRGIIDVSLASGKPTAALSRKYAVSQDSLDRHRARHLRPAIARAAATRADFAPQALVQRLAELLERCDRAMDETEKNRDFKTLGGLIRESRELTVTIGRTIGLWSDKPPTIAIDNRRQVIATLDARSLDELLAMRSRLEQLGVTTVGIRRERCQCNIIVIIVSQTTQGIGVLGAGKRTNRVPISHFPDWIDANDGIEGDWVL